MKPGTSPEARLVYPRYSVLYRAIVSVASFILTSFHVCAQYHPIENAVHIEEQRFLWYAQYRNTFDSATLLYNFGEVVLHTQSMPVVPLFISINPSDAYHHRAPGLLIAGSDHPGVDSTLLNQARTQVFYIPQGAGSSISFVRIPHVQTCYPFGSWEPGDTTPTGQWDPRLARFTVGRNRVLDTTSFIVELIDPSNGAALCVLDSITVFPNPSSDIVDCTGTSPHLPLRTHIPLPPTSWGKLAYVRVRTVRLGPTPYGMVLSRYPQVVPLSRSVNHGAISPDSNEYEFETMYQRTLHDTWYNRFMTMLHNHIDSTSCFPYWAMLGSTGITGEQQRNTYFSLYSTWRADTSVFNTCHEGTSYERQWYMSTTDTNIAFPKQRIVPSSISSENGVINVEIRPDNLVYTNIDTRPHTLATRLINTNGSVVHATPTTMIQEQGTLDVSLNTLSSGAYIALTYVDGSAQMAVPFMRVR